MKYSEQIGIIPPMNGILTYHHGGNTGVQLVFSVHIVLCERVRGLLWCFTRMKAVRFFLRTMLVQQFPEDW